MPLGIEVTGVAGNAGTIIRLIEARNAAIAAATSECAATA